MTDLIVRSAVADDFEAVGHLCVQAYWAGGGMVSGDSDRYERVLRDVAARADHGSVLVAVRADRVVGTVTITPPGSHFAEICTEGELEFRFLAVAPAHWGTGVGEALSAACIDHARSIGARRVVICVLDGNRKAAGLYERQGFVRMPERDLRVAPQVRLRGYALELT